MLTSSTPLFAEFDQDEIHILEPLFENYSCPADTIIFGQGEKPSYFYVLLDGEVAIHYKPYDGPPIVLTRLRKGDIFGWSAVIGSEAYTSSIISTTEIEAIRIKGTDLWFLASRHPEIGRRLLEKFARAISFRWRHAEEQVKDLLNKAIERAQRGRNTGG